MLQQGQRILLTVDALGRSTIDAQGFHGTSCKEATAPLEKALAGATGELVTVAKTEMFEAAPEQHLTENAY